MALCTEAQLENLMGIDFDASSAPTTTEITAFITLASKRVMKDITRHVLNEKNNSYLPPYVGNRDGDWGQTNASNKVFFTRHIPLADYDVDASYTDDVRVDLFDTSDDSWDEDAAVTSVSQRRGKITMTAAPSATDDVYMDYYYYVGGEEPDTSIVEIAATAWVAYLVLQTKSTEVATKIASYTFGGHAVNKESIVNLSKIKSDEYKLMYKMAIATITKGLYAGEQSERIY